MARIKHRKNHPEFDTVIKKSFPSLPEVYLDDESMEKSVDHPKSSPSANAIATRATFLGGRRRGQRASRKGMSKSSINDITLMDVFLGKDFSKAGAYDDHPSGSQSVTQAFAQPRYSIARQKRQRLESLQEAKNNQRRSIQTTKSKNTTESKNPAKSNRPAFTPRQSGVSETSTIDNVQTPQPTNNNNIHPLALPVDFSNRANARNPVNPNRKLNLAGQEAKATDPDEEFFFSFSMRSYRQREKR